MSAIERNKGKLIKVSWDEIKELYPNAAVDDIEWDTKNTFTVINGEFYRVEWEVNGYTDIIEFSDVTKNDDGSIDFHTLHYNGGSHWTELVEWSLNRESNE